MHPIFILYVAKHVRATTHVHNVMHTVPYQLEYMVFFHENFSYTL